MAQKYNSRYGEGIFDIVVKLNVGLENIVSFCLDNGIASLTDIVLANTEITYTPEVSISKVSSVSVVGNNTFKYLSAENQSLFDIGLMLNGGLGDIVSFAINNNVSSISDNVVRGFEFTYEDKNKALTNWISKNGYVFTTGSHNVNANEGFFLLQENGFFLLQQDGFKIIL